MTAYVIPNAIQISTMHARVSLHSSFPHTLSNPRTDGVSTRSLPLEPMRAVRAEGRTKADSSVSPATSFTLHPPLTSFCQPFLLALSLFLCSPPSPYRLCLISTNSSHFRLILWSSSLLPRCHRLPTRSTYNSIHSLRSYLETRLTTWSVTFGEWSILSFQLLLVCLITRLPDLKMKEDLQTE